MTWQPEKPTLQFGKPLNHRQEWERAFIAEWCCLAEGRADLEQTADAAAELYEVNSARDPMEVARQEWGTPG